MYLNFESQEKQYVMIRSDFHRLHLLVNLSSNNLNNVLISRDKSQKSTIARPNLAIKHTHPYNLYLVFRNLTKFIYLRKEPNHSPKTMKIFNFDFISTLKKELACQKETKYAFYNKYVHTYFEYVSKLETKLNLQDSSHFKFPY